MVWKQKKRKEELEVHCHLQGCVLSDLKTSGCPYLFEAPSSSMLHVMAWMRNAPHRSTYVNAVGSLLVSLLEKVVELAEGSVSLRIQCDLSFLTAKPASSSMSSLSSGALLPVDGLKLTSELYFIKKANKKKKMKFKLTKKGFSDAYFSELFVVSTVLCFTAKEAIYNRRHSFAKLSQKNHADITTFTLLSIDRSWDGEYMCIYVHAERGPDYKCVCAEKKYWECDKVNC
ncbi:hypothetical protein STEG23_024201, partial [Scotinomys teguina]